MNSLIKLIFDLLAKLLPDILRSKQAPPASIPADPPSEPVQNYLSSREIAAVKKYRPVYEWAVKTVKSDIPWQVMAAIHYRESSFSLKGEEPWCGPFAIDPGGDTGTLSTRIAAHVSKIVNKYGLSPTIYDQPLDENFSTAALVGADELKEKIRTPLVGGTGGIDLVALADAIWGYNGRSQFHTPSGNPDPGQSSYKYSPYVSNDPHRGIKLRLKGTVPDPTVQGGRRRIDVEDQRPGAMAVYRELVARETELA